MTGMPPLLICCWLAAASVSAVSGCESEPCTAWHLLDAVKCSQPAHRQQLQCKSRRWQSQPLTAEGGVQQPSDATYKTSTRCEAVFC